MTCDAPDPAVLGLLRLLPRWGTHAVPGALLATGRDGDVEPVVRHVAGVARMGVAAVDAVDLAGYLPWRRWLSRRALARARRPCVVLVRGVDRAPPRLAALLRSLAADGGVALVGTAESPGDLPVALALPPLFAHAHVVASPGRPFRASLAEGVARDADVAPCPALDAVVSGAAGATRAWVLDIAGAACDAALAGCSDAMSDADVRVAVARHPYARAAPNLPGPVAALLSRHEAGHAVAACLLPGCGALDSVTVVAVGANPGHATVLRRAEPPDPALAARQHGVVMLAGPAAERWGGGDRPWIASDLCGARLSARTLAALAGDCPEDAPLDHPAVDAAFAGLEAEAAALVAAHADAIDRVAAMLRRLGTLDGEEVYAACGTMRPPA